MHKHETQNLETLLGVIYLLRKTNPEFPIQYTLCLLEIASAPGLSLTELSQKTGLKLSTVSRIIHALSDRNKNGKKYGFLSVKISETERRRKELTLSPKGEKLIEALSKTLRTPAEKQHEKLKNGV